MTDCNIFKQSKDRVGLLRDHKLCIFCAGHRWSLKVPCKKRNFLKCDKCGDKHITELHITKCIEAAAVAMITGHTDEIDLRYKKVSTQTILPTALVNIILANGERVKVRAIIDQCSQKCLITEDLVQKLGLKKTAIEGGQRIISPGGVGTKTKDKVYMSLKIGAKESLVVCANVVSVVTGALPIVTLDVDFRSL